MFIVGFMEIGATVQKNSWIGDSEHDTLEEARERVDSLAKNPTVLASAAFPSHHWNFGLPLCKPAILIDKTDYSNAPIRNQAIRNIINSASSTVL
jgi:hypothetical protein